MSGYAIRGGEEGKRRMDLVAHAFAPTTDALFERAGIRAGMRCLDLGCGSGHVSRRLATLVGPTGSVVAVDIDAVKLEAAQQDADRAGLTNVQFHQANVPEIEAVPPPEWAAPASYDIVYARFILSHLPRTAQMVQRMRNAMRQPGRLLIEDIDYAGAFCDPPDAAFQHYCELYAAVVRRRGGDADVGRRLYGLCVDAELQDVDVRVVQLAHAGQAPEKAVHLITLLNIREALIAEELIAPSQYDDLVAALTRSTDDPRSLIGFPRIFQIVAARLA